MKLKTVSLLLALIVILSGGTFALASDISGAAYQGTVLVSNNGTDATNTRTVCTINTTNIIAGGFINASANNTVIRDHLNQDTAFMPGYTPDGNPWCIYVDAINEYANLEYTLYTGATGGDLYYFPGSTGMTVADAASLEIGDNFTTSISGMVLADYAANKNIIYKADAYRLYVSDDNQVRAAILDGATDTIIMRPDGAGDETNITSVSGAATHWQAVSDASDLTFVYTNGTTYVRDMYEVSDNETYGLINSVTVHYRIYNVNASYISYFIPHLKIDGTTYNGTEQSITAAAWVEKTEVYNTNPSTSAAWNWNEIYDMQIGISAKTSNVSTAAECSDIWIVVDYDAELVATSLTTTTGEHDISVSADTTNLVLDIDGTTNSTALSGNTTPDNANAWYFVQYESMPYMDYALIQVDGANVSRWTWEYGTTFTDSIGSNDATPTFRTTTSDADVTATLLTFVPVSAADAPAYTIDDPVDFIDTANITMSGGFTTTINATYPGSEVMSDIATAGETPIQFMTLIISLIVLLAVSFSMMYFLRNNGTTSIFIQVIVLAALMGIMVAVGVLDWWLLFIFLVLGIAVAMASGQRTFSGTGITGNNTFGFLAMAFIGMTTINRILEGRFIQASDLEIANDVLVFQPFNLWGWFNIPVPNLGFITDGIPALVQWDYSFFGGNAQIIQFMLYSITAVVSFILLVLCFGAIYQMLSRLRL